MSENDGHGELRVEGGGAVRELVEGRDFHYVPAAPDKLLVLHRQADVAACFNVSTRTFREWVERGCPGKPGHYVVAEIMRWYLGWKAGTPVCGECLRPL